MTKLETRRDYLVRLGLAKPGRGKFSNAAKEALAKAEAEGMKFSDTGAPAPKPAKDKPDEPTAPVQADPRESAYILPSDFRFPMGEYVAFSRDENGKRVMHTLAECCNTCRVSLTNHACNTPTIYNYIPVTIERV